MGYGDEYESWWLGQQRHAKYLYYQLWLCAKREADSTNKVHEEPATEQEHDFTLVYHGPEVPTQQLEDALFDAGCDDATIVYRGGFLYLYFIREAMSQEDAIYTATQDVKAATTGAKLVRIECGEPTWYPVR